MSQYQNLCTVGTIEGHQKLAELAQAIVKNHTENDNCTAEDCSLCSIQFFHVDPDPAEQVDSVFIEIKETLIEILREIKALRQDRAQQ